MSLLFGFRIVQTVWYFVFILLLEELFSFVYKLYVRFQGQNDDKYNTY